MRSKTLPRVMLAAPHSGAGKTTITMGLAYRLSQCLALSCFKVGPDYIDPGYLSAAAGSPVANLDTWLLPKKAVVTLFDRHVKNTDLALVEGVMGLFDGRGLGSAGSSAQVARWLRIPVVLVVDASRTGRSLAALVAGFKNIDPRINLAAVFLNKIGSPTHLRIARSAIEKIAKVPVIGFLKNNPDLQANSRHLGLAPQPAALMRELAARISESLAGNVDFTALLEIARSAGELPACESMPLKTRDPAENLRGRVRIAIAQDEAFCFYYRQSLALLEDLGAELKFFSPIKDRSLPAGLSGLWLGGGWPELHAGKLAGNERMLASIRSAVDAGLPVYAECGGLVYLTECLYSQGRRWGMVGVLPAEAHMTTKRQGLGYRRARFHLDTILAGKGTKVKGHEFHWTNVKPSKRGRFAPAYEFAGAGLEGFASENVLASYLHLNWLGQPRLAENFLETCGKAQSV